MYFLGQELYFVVTKVAWTYQLGPVSLLGYSFIR
jgi:hypothetical protein